MIEKANWKLYPRATKNGLRKQLVEVKNKGEAYLGLRWLM